MAELLLEILSEEIPARMQVRAAADLERLISDGLKSAGLTFSSSNNFVTPRRLTLVIDGLAVSTPESSEERRGPRSNAPEKAIQGFLNSVGTSIDNVEKRETPPEYAAAAFDERTLHVPRNFGEISAGRDFEPSLPGIP